MRINDAVLEAQKDGMGALALTDLSNLFGLVTFLVTFLAGVALVGNATMSIVALIYVTTWKFR